MWADNGGAPVCVPIRLGPGTVWWQSPSIGMRKLCHLGGGPGWGLLSEVLALVRSVAVCWRCSEMTEGGRFSVRPIFHLM